MNSGVTTRAYRQGARAEASAETHRNIVAAFMRHARERWFDEITLDDVAREAGVTAQTVIRRFGGKEGLLQALAQQVEGDITQRRVTSPGDARAAIDSLVLDYELVGDFVYRMLVQEERHPILTPLLDQGRRHHRAWVAAVFEPWLVPLPRARRERRLAGLIAACDLYTWKLLRRDFGHSRQEVAAIMLDLVGGPPDGRNL